MPEYLELDLAGAALRVELSDTGTPASGSGAAADRSADDGPDLPEGLGTLTPVARGGGRRAAVLATEALRTALRPLGPLLEEVHTAVTSVPHAPQELSVEFGIQIGHDLKLGIVGANGNATMTVSATWHHDPAQSTPRPDGVQPGGTARQGASEHRQG
ncbi:CU044_2847 family protein [Streptomyces sp. NPDC051310]|uniref:CU044_2847 family protein n=1 Tax=Streptomyces sp. NPDC051310 TaxID=3365649 RepID=UPI00379C73AE